MSEWNNLKRSTIFFLSRNSEENNNVAFSGRGDSSASLRLFDFNTRRFTKWLILLLRSWKVYDKKSFFLNFIQMQNKIISILKKLLKIFCFLWVNHLFSTIVAVPLLPKTQNVTHKFFVIKMIHRNVKHQTNGFGHKVIIQEVIFLKFLRRKKYRHVSNFLFIILHFGLGWETRAPKCTCIPLLCAPREITKKNLFELPCIFNEGRARCLLSILLNN